MNKNWVITFDDGSTATYFDFNLLDAVKTAVADWAPFKHPVSWTEDQIDVWDIPLD